MLRIGRPALTLIAIGLMIFGSCSSSTDTSRDESGAEATEAAEPTDGADTAEPTDGADATGAAEPDSTAQPTPAPRVYSEFALDSATESCVDEAIADDAAAQAAVADDADIDQLEPSARGVLMAAMIDCGVPVSEVILGDGANAGAAAYAECIVSQSGDDLAKVIAGVGFAEDPPAPAEYRDATINALAACTSAGVADEIPDNEADRFTYLTTTCMDGLGPDRTRFLIDVTYSLGEAPTQQEVQEVADRYGVNPAEAVGGSYACTVVLPVTMSMIEAETGEPLRDASVQCMAELDPVTMGSEDTDTESVIAECLSESEAEAFATAASAADE